jgi:hypothetical protein
VTPFLQTFLYGLVNDEMYDCFGNAHVGGWDPFVESKNSSLSINTTNGSAGREASLLVELKSCFYEPYGIRSCTCYETWKSDEGHVISTIPFKEYVHSSNYADLLVTCE